MTWYFIGDELWVEGSSISNLHFRISSFQWNFKLQIRKRKFQIRKTYRPRGIPCHISLPDTVASFRTWRGFRAPITRPPKACSLSGKPLKTERVGFEPTVELPPHTLSKRAP